MVLIAPALRPVETVWIIACNNKGENKTTHSRWGWFVIYWGWRTSLSHGLRQNNRFVIPFSSIIFVGFFLTRAFARGFPVREPTEMLIVATFFLSNIFTLLFFSFQNINSQLWRQDVCVCVCKEMLKRKKNCMQIVWNLFTFDFLLAFYSLSLQKKINIIFIDIINWRLYI